MLDHGPTQAPKSEDWGLTQTRYWKLKLCWYPKQCYLTGKPLWGQRAYHGKRWIAGPGEPVIEHYWIKRDEFIIWNLKRNHHGII